MWHVCRPQHISILIVRPARRRHGVAIVEALVLRHPLDAPLQTGIVEVPEADQAEDHVTCQARVDTAVTTSAGPDSSILGEAAAFLVLGVVEDELAGVSDVGIVAVGAELGEGDELPDGALVFGFVERLRIAPETSLVLGGEDSGDGAERS